MQDQNPKLPTALPGDAACALDPDVLAQLRALDPDGGGSFLRRVLETYQRSMGRLLTDALSAHERADLEGLSYAMHTLKSASAGVGALQLAALCEAVESLLRRGELAGLPELMRSFNLQAGCVARAVGLALQGDAGDCA